MRQNLTNEPTMPSRSINSQPAQFLMGSSVHDFDSPLSHDDFPLSTCSSHPSTIQAYGRRTKQAHNKQDSICSEPERTGYFNVRWWDCIEKKEQLQYYRIKLVRGSGFFCFFCSLRLIILQFS